MKKTIDEKIKIEEEKIINSYSKIRKLRALKANNDGQMSMMIPQNISVQKYKGASENV